MNIFEKFQPTAAALQRVLELGDSPFGVVTEELRSATEGVINGREVILAGTNNYLGLTFAPECIEAAKEATESQGTGTTGSRMANGTYGEHVALERELADFMGTDSAIVFTTGYQATMGTVSTLMGPGDVILLDADSHASIYDGSRRGGADFLRFRHNDVDDLERRLESLGERAANTLIVVEGIYSMLGDRAPLRDIVELKRRYGSYLLVDEAHSLGVLGANGRGLAEYAGGAAAAAGTPGDPRAAVGECASDLRRAALDGLPGGPGAEPGGGGGDGEPGAGGERLEPAAGAGGVRQPGAAAGGAEELEPVALQRQRGPYPRAGGPDSGSLP